MFTRDGKDRLPLLLGAAVEVVVPVNMGTSHEVPRAITYVMSVKERFVATERRPRRTTNGQHGSSQLYNTLALRTSTEAGL